MRRAVARATILVALALALDAGRALGDEPGKEVAPVKNWEVRATLERDHFTLGESIPLAIVAKFVGSGGAVRPALDGAAPGAPLLEVRRDGGAATTVRTDDYDRGALPRVPDFVRQGGAATGTLDLAHYLEPIEAGSYEVVVVLASDATARSNAVRFVVRVAATPLATASPVTADGLGVRFVLRAEARADATHLVLVLPGRDGRKSLDLGAAPVATAAVAVSILRPAAAGVRPWVVAVAGRRLARTFVDSEPHVHRFPEADLPFEGRLVAALAGVARTKGPPPSPPEEMSLDHVADDEPWPDLHLVFVDGARLLGVTLAPVVSAVPALQTRPLPAVPLLAAATALTEEKRLVLVALAEGPKTAVFAHLWTTAGFGEPRFVLRTDGVPLALEAIALENGDARVVALAPGREKGELVSHLALVRADGSARELAPKVIAPKVTDGLGHFRVRIGGESETWLLAERADGQRVVFPPEATEPWLAPVPRKGWWDLELLGGHIEAIAVDEKRGLVAESVAPNDPDAGK